jgi:hypothetical protein
LRFRRDAMHGRRSGETRRGAGVGARSWQWGQRVGCRAALESSPPVGAASAEEWPSESWRRRSVVLSAGWSRPKARTRWMPRSGLRAAARHAWAIPIRSHLSSRSAMPQRRNGVFGMVMGVSGLRSAARRPPRQGCLALLEWLLPCSAARGGAGQQLPAAFRDDLDAAITDFDGRLVVYRVRRHRHFRRHRFHLGHGALRVVFMIHVRE